MKAVSVWADGGRSVLDDGRGHSVVVDLPTDQNGTNAGPTALELCLMSLAGCTTTIFKIVAGRRNFAYKAFRVELEAEKPRDALTITSVKGKMEIVTDAEESEVGTVLKLTLKTCPVGVIFANAKIKYDWTLIVKKP
ncbi:MAG TPA: OsmC family protein [Candidatus Bathyarchaeia archaeon]|nr:OsmC family protein [Candidatus Bathyarchaeia archaeon]